MENKTIRVAHRSWTILFADETLPRQEAEQVGNAAYRAISYKQETLRLQQELKLANLINQALLFCCALSLLVIMMLLIGKR